MHVDIQQLSDVLQRIVFFPLIKLGETDLTLAGLFKFACIIVLVFFCERLLRRELVRRFLQRTHFQPSMQYAVGKIVGYLFITFGFYLALKLVGIDLSSLAVLVGAIGVGLGFGLQNVISNFVSGLIILAERPIAIGDRVEMGDVAGLVTKISLRSTIVVTNDNITIIVPNSDFITTKVTNWSYGDPKVRLRLPVGVAYGTDPEKLRRVLLEVAAEHSNVMRQPAPEVFFSGFGDSSLNFEFAVWTSEMASKPRRFRSELNYAVERKLRENNIEIPFPQRDLHLRSGNFVLQAPPPEGQERREGWGLVEGGGEGRSPKAEVRKKAETRNPKQPVSRGADRALSKAPIRVEFPSDPSPAGHPVRLRARS